MSYNPDTFYDYQAQKLDMTFSTEDNFYSLDQGLKEYDQLIKENLWLKDQLEKKRDQLERSAASTSSQGHSHYPALSDMDGNDIVMREIVRRNKFLEEKNYELKRQDLKQRQQLRKVEESEQWQDRFRCCPQKCYHKKYLQLLRIKSPLL